MAGEPHTGSAPVNYVRPLFNSFFCDGLLVYELSPPLECPIVFYLHLLLRRV